MKLKYFLSNVVENKRNGQLNTCIKKNKLKKAGISKDDLLNVNVNFKLREALFED